MSTGAVAATSASARRPVYRPVNRTVERGFFSGMAILLCVIVFIGFSPTYFGAGMLRARYGASRALSELPQDGVDVRVLLPLQDLRQLRDFMDKPTRSTRRHLADRRSYASTATSPFSLRQTEQRSMSRPDQTS